MGHELIKATVIPDIVKMIQDTYGISEDMALGRFFRSVTYLNYDDDKTGLYGQSALHIFSLYAQEQNRVRTASSAHPAVP